MLPEESKLNFLVIPAATTCCETKVLSLYVVVSHAVSALFDHKREICGYESARNRRLACCVLSACE